MKSRIRLKNEESRGEEVYNYTHRVITRKANWGPQYRRHSSEKRQG